MKTCAKCFNFIASIPLKGENILIAQIRWRDAVARCSKGHLVVESSPDQRERVFKNMLRSPDEDRMALQKAASGCVDYDP